MARNKGGRPRRTDLYRKINFHCTAEADADISYVQGNVHGSGLPMCTCRGDAIVLCIRIVADMIRREQHSGEIIPWRK